MFLKFSFVLLAWLAATHGSPYGCSSCDDSSSYDSWWPSQSWSQLPQWSQWSQWPQLGQSWNWGQSWPNWGQQSWSNWGQQGWPSWGQSWPSWGQSWPNWGQSWPSWGQSWPNWGWPQSTDGNAPCYGCGQPGISPPAPTSAPTPPPPDNYQLEDGGGFPGGESLPGGRILPGGSGFPGGFPGGIPSGGDDWPIPTGSWSDFVTQAKRSPRGVNPRPTISPKPVPEGFKSVATSSGRLLPAITSYITESRAPRRLWWPIWYCLRPENMYTAACECLWAQLFECYMNPNPHSLCRCANNCKWWRWGWWGWDKSGPAQAYSAAQENGPSLSSA